MASAGQAGRRGHRRRAAGSSLFICRSSGATFSTAAPTSCWQSRHRRLDHGAPRPAPHSLTDSVDAWPRRLPWHRHDVGVTRSRRRRARNGRSARFTIDLHRQPAASPSLRRTRPSSRRRRDADAVNGTPLRRLAPRPSTVAVKLVRLVNDGTAPRSPTAIVAAQITPVGPRQRRRSVAADPRPSTVRHIDARGRSASAAPASPASPRSASPSRNWRDDDDLRARRPSPSRARSRRVTATEPVSHGASCTPAPASVDAVTFGRKDAAGNNVASGDSRARRDAAPSSPPPISRRSTSADGRRHRSTSTCDRHARSDTVHRARTTAHHVRTPITFYCSDVADSFTVVFGATIVARRQHHPHGRGRRTQTASRLPTLNVNVIVSSGAITPAPLQDLATARRSSRTSPRSTSAPSRPS